MTQQELSFTAESRREAHELIEPSKQAIRHQILTVLFNQGPLHADAIANYLEMKPYCIRPRLTELNQDGIIHAVGRAPGFNGIKITIWKLVDNQKSIG